jgi:hypothetical protein
VLERAFMREGGHDPREADAQRLDALAEETDDRTEAGERLAADAERAAETAHERYRLTGTRDDLLEAERLDTEAAGHRGAADALRREAERQHEDRC